MRRGKKKWKERERKGEERWERDGKERRSRKES